MSNLLETLKQVGEILKIKKENPEKSVSEIVKEINDNKLKDN
jgi:serine/threonine protein phosphatase PrpC